MKLVLHAVHATMTAAIREAVESQLSDPLQRIFPSEAAELQVHLVENGAKGGQSQEVRVTLFIPGTSPVHLSEASADMLKSIALLSDKLDHAAKQHHAKQQQYRAESVRAP